MPKLNGEGVDVSEPEEPARTNVVDLKKPAAKMTPIKPPPARRSGGWLHRVDVPVVYDRYLPHRRRLVPLLGCGASFFISSDSLNLRNVSNLCPASRVSLMLYFRS
jgi:hypothetical protein